MTQETELFDKVMSSRRSIRRFLPTPVERTVVEDILRAARHAPSGSNIQPWQVTVLTGAPLAELGDAVVAASREEPEAHEEEWLYYPRTWSEPYLARRRKVGWDLYGLLGVEKGDREGTRRHFERNYRFFGAPVALIFTIDRVMERGSWLDYGMFVQSVMLAARARGLDTCAQGAFGKYHRVVSRVLQLPEDRMLVCAMALGHADPDAPENGLRTVRAEVEDFTEFRGFPAAVALPALPPLD